MDVLRSTGSSGSPAGEQNRRERELHRKRLRQAASGFLREMWCSGKCRAMLGQLLGQLPGLVLLKLRASSLEEVTYSILMTFSGGT